MTLAARPACPWPSARAAAWDATYNRMRELIEAGHIGRVLHVTGFGRCALSHNGSHLLTLVAYLAGGPAARCRWVFGQMESDAQAAGDADLSGNGMLQFEDGVQAFVRTTECGVADWDFEVTGTEGRLRGVNDAEEVEFWRLAPALLPGRRREPARHLFPAPGRRRQRQRAHPAGPLAGGRGRRGAPLQRRGRAPGPGDRHRPARVPTAAAGPGSTCP